MLHFRVFETFAVYQINRSMEEGIILWVKEQIIFPEINVDKITRVLGMDITIVTSAKSDNEAYELLKFFGMPFIKKEIKTA